MFSRMFSAPFGHQARHERLANQDEEEDVEAGVASASASVEIDNSVSVSNAGNIPSTTAIVVDAEDIPFAIVSGSSSGGLQHSQNNYSLSNENNNENTRRNSSTNSTNGSAESSGGVDSSSQNQNNNSNNNNTDDNNLAHEPNGDQDQEVASDDETNGIYHPSPTTHPFLTSQIQSERDHRHRRQITCTLFLLFLLGRLWLAALVDKDMGLLFLAMMATTWTWRWVVAWRERNEEYDREMERAAGVDEGEGAEDDGITGSGTNTRRGRARGVGAEGGPDAVINFDPDLGLMSFQAQLALAILESQRQMFENGGYGGNDRSDVHDGPGVTDEAKKKWKKFDWEGDEEDMAKKIINAGAVREGMVTPPSSSTTIQRIGSNESNYGSVGTTPTTAEEDDEEEELQIQRQLDGPLFSPLEEGLRKNQSSNALIRNGAAESGGASNSKTNSTTAHTACKQLVEDPSCSICLCEYEKGETITQLPCGHLYHNSCLDAWTKNHVRCPLCNFDLMTGFEVPNPPNQGQSNNSNGGGRRRSLTIGGATLGRRRSARRANRRINRAFASMEDSIV